MSFQSLLQRIARALDAKKVPYMIIGGQAVMVHGKPRQTLDIDVTLKMSQESHETIQALIDAIGLQPANEKAFEILDQNLVLPTIDRESEIPVELIFSPYGFEDEVIARAVVKDLDNVPIRFIAPSDLVIYKILAGRPRDIDDVRGIIQNSKDLLDEVFIAQTLRDIEQATDQSGLLEAWESLLQATSSAASDK